MRAPVLARRLLLEAPERVADGAGGFSEVWQVLGQHWAEVLAGPGAEDSGDLLTLWRVALRIVVRGAPAGSPARPVPGQRFREGDRVFPILAVVERDPRGRHLICFAREEAAA